MMQADVTSHEASASELTPGGNVLSSAVTVTAMCFKSGRRGAQGGPRFHRMYKEAMHQK